MPLAFPLKIWHLTEEEIFFSIVKRSGIFTWLNNLSLIFNVFLEGSPLRMQSAPTSLCCTRSWRAQPHIPPMQGCGSYSEQRSEDTSAQLAPCARSGPNSAIREKTAQPPMSNPNSATPEFPVAGVISRPLEQCKKSTEFLPSIPLPPPTSKGFS